jgi:hypothetical protein
VVVAEVTEIMLLVKLLAQVVLAEAELADVDKLLLLLLQEL